MSTMSSQRCCSMWKRNVLVGDAQSAHAVLVAELLEVLLVGAPGRGGWEGGGGTEERHNIRNGVQGRARLGGRSQPTQLLCERRRTTR